MKDENAPGRGQKTRRGVSTAWIMAGGGVDHRKLELPGANAGRGKRVDANVALEALSH